MSSIGKDILDTIIGEALVSAHCEGVLVWKEDADKILSDKFEYLLDENIELHTHMDRLQKEKEKILGDISTTYYYRRGDQ